MSALHFTFQQMSNRNKLTGGEPITIEKAIVRNLTTEICFQIFEFIYIKKSLKELRKTVFGSAAAPPRGEWTRTPILFGSHKEELSV